MVMSLVSIFDPSCDFFFIKNLNMTILFILLIPLSPFWNCSTFFSTLKKKVKVFYLSFEGKGFIFFFSVFFFVFFFNIESLTPFSFGLTGQFFFHCLFGMTLWLVPIIYMLWNFSEVYIAHFTPQNSPIIMSFFLVPVEIISTLIRPIALSLRLMSNMVAGHMILALMSGTAWGISIMGISVGIIYYFFMLFEVMVCIIQAYVFSMLLFLYWKEGNLS